MPKTKQKAPKQPSKKEQEKEAKRLRALVTSSISPILLKNAKSVKHAKDICKTLIVGMDAIFAKQVKDFSTDLQNKPLENLALNEFMTDKKEYMAEWELVELLKGESIVASKMLVEGMGKEIDRLLDKEQAERNLDTLETEWL